MIETNLFCSLRHNSIAIEVSQGQFEGAGQDQQGSRDKANDDHQCRMAGRRGDDPSYES